MRKIFCSVFAAFLLVASISVPIEAKSKNTDDTEKVSVDWGVKKLNKKQVKYLKDEVGLTEEELENFPTEILEELIKNNAKKIASNHKEHKFTQKKPNGENDEFQTLVVGEEIDRGYLVLDAIAFEVDSDKSGKKKFYFYGSYSWTESPGFELIDALSIGWPDSAEIVLPMSSGKVDQHYLQYCEKPDNVSSAPWDCSRDTSPEDWDNGMG